MKNILKEPLLHFFLLGAALFIAYSLISKPGDGAAPGTIVVTAGQIEHLAAGFAKTWQRPPNDAETKVLIDDWVRDEISTREAMALGLDKDDPVIRRRLRQKLEFVSDDITAQTDPDDAALNAYMQAHPESFRIAPLYTFSQVYLDPSKHGDRLAGDAAQLLAQLKQARGKADVAKMGEPFLLETTFTAVPASEVAKQFGEEFAASLSKLPPGEWQGPIESAYGVHLVLVSQRTEARLPQLTDVRDAVLREWANARRLDGTRKFYEDLQKRYTVTIKALESGKGQEKSAVAK